MKHSVFFLLLLLLPTSVFAVGFANMPPVPDREFIHVPGKTIEIPLAVTSEQNIDVSLSTPTPANPETLGTTDDDNILEYVRIDDPNPGGPPRNIKIIFDLPDEMKPGLYLVDVTASDLRGEGGVVAVAKTRIRFKIWVLDDEKNLDIVGFYIPPIAEGLNANATVSVASRTKQKINAIYGVIEVYNGSETLSSDKSSIFGLESGQSHAFFQELKTELIPGGEYSANVTVFYDGIQESSGPVVLKIGTLHVDISSYTRTLEYNTTNRFLFNISNQWNRELQKVFAVVSMKNQIKQTASINILPFETSEYEVYFDRDSGIQPGPVPVNITVYFQDYDVLAEEYQERTESFLVKPEVKVPEVVEEPVDIGVYVLVGVIAVLLLLLIIILILFMRKSDGKEENSIKKEEPPQEHDTQD